jgi:gluconolactonase
MWQQAERYPDPRVISLDPSFDRYRVAFSAVERLATGYRWTEGPVWFGDGRYLLWSDIPNNQMLRWDEETGAVSVFRKPSNFANGNTRDRQGRLVTCEHGRRVTRTEYDGSVTVLLERFEGKRLNSPNDLVVKSDGSIWFTDPPMGIAGFYEGNKAEQELPHSVYRIDGASGEAGAGRVFFDAGAGTIDGMRADVDGNLWCGWGMGSDEMDGVMVISPAGKIIGRIALPERCANLCFGGRARNRLFMASSQSIYSVFVNTQGAPGG